jgi:hypothetical protein
LPVGFLSSASRSPEKIDPTQGLRPDEDAPQRRSGEPLIKFFISDSQLSLQGIERVPFSLPKAFLDIFTDESNTVKRAAARLQQTTNLPKKRAGKGKIRPGREFSPYQISEEIHQGQVIFPATAAATLAVVASCRASGLSEE